MFHVLIGALFFSTVSFSLDADEAFELLMSDEPQFVSLDAQDTVEDRFTALGRFFGPLESQTAVAPTPQELEPWWSGVCYYDGARNTPLAGLLLAKQTNIPQNEGPLFQPSPAPPVFKLYLKADEGRPTTAFERISPDGRRTIEDHFAGIQGSLTRTRVIDRSLTSSYLDGSYPVVRRVRKIERATRPYYVSESVAATDQTWGGKSYPEGTVWGRCYFWERVVFTAPVR